MKIYRFICMALFSALAACGGGGGNPGGTSGTGGTGGATGGGVVTVQAYSRVNGAEAAINSFAASDLNVHAKVSVKDKSGKAISNAIVKFSENGSGLLVFLPASAAALTNSAGEADVDIKAASLASLGATQLVATVSIADGSGVDVSLKGTQNISITGATVQDPQSLATAINFTSAVPSDKSIVIQGAGGGGRSETALLTFTVVDSSGSPLKGVGVDFVVIPAGSVSLSASEGVSNSSGQVTATVNSLKQPTSVIVNATVRGRTISTQSDSLTVTTGVSTQRGFDLSASKFNLDADLSGDSSTLTVRIVDANGNPVADGVPVVAQANFGGVGSSDRGGCTTSNGSCTVDYKVQNPRPPDGTPATVVFSTQTGQGTVISDTLSLWVTSVGNANLYATPNGGAPISNIALTVADVATCKFTGLTLFVGTAAGFAAPANTAITVRSVNDIASPTIVAGAPTLDRAGSRTGLDLSATGKAGGAGGSDTWVFTLTAGPSKTVRRVTVPVTVPACPKAP